MRMIRLVFLAALASSAVGRHVYVMGGHEAQFGAWKYQVSLREDGSHICGGSLISAEWVLTAAHCVDSGSSASKYSVAVGLHDRNDVRFEHFVKSIIKHEKYNAAANKNDIAVIRLKTSVDMSNKNVESASLAADDGFTYAGSICFISGWGRTIPGGPAATRLQEAKVDCLTNAQCSYYWGPIIWKSQICMFDNFNKGISAGQGDSGGPMSCYRDGEWYVVGVASFIQIHAPVSYPSVYTRVSEFRGWIKQKTGL